MLAIWGLFGLAGLALVVFNRRLGEAIYQRNRDGGVKVFRAYYREHPKLVIPAVRILVVLIGMVWIVACVVTVTHRRA